MKLRTYGPVFALIISATAALPVAGQTAGSQPTCATTTPTIVGTGGNDRLRGTPDDDVIDGRGGDDVIRGTGGDDLVCGGSGADRLFGGPGNDRIYGQGDGHISTGEDDDLHIGDLVAGGRGDDVMDVGRPDVNDEDLYAEPEVFDLSDGRSPVNVDLRTGSALFASGEHDRLRLHGGVNHDRIVLGTRFSDVIVGTRDDDRLIGGVGDDILRGLVGEDRLVGGRGDDRLLGGPDHDGSRDPIEPTSGGDELVPGPGEDFVAPGADSLFPQDSVLYMRSTRSVDVDLGRAVATGQGHDTFRIDGSLTVVGTRFDDTLRGDRFRNTLVGMSGDDLLRARSGSDELWGDGVFSNVERGHDRLYGQLGNDYFVGGPLSDLMSGGPGRDGESDRPATNTCRSMEGHYPRGC